MDLSHEFDGSSVLVTGGAGFIGSNLVRILLSSGVNSITVVDNLLSSEEVSVPCDPRVTFTKGSIADPFVLSGISDIYDYIFHLSTFHGNQNSIQDPVADHDNNLITTLRLLEHVKGFRGLKKLVYSGAGCAVAEKTYGKAQATLEDAPISLQMDSPYSISKIVGEFYMVYYFNRHGVPTVRARFQNVYGPGEILGAGLWRGTPATVWRNVVPTFIFKALHRQPLPLEGGGGASRDFIFVEDVVLGLMLCALRGASGDVYNIASGVETSVKTLAQHVNEIAGSLEPFSMLPKRTWDHSGHRFGSTQKAKQELGFEAITSLKEGLGRTILWTRENMSLIELCLKRHEQQVAAYQARQIQTRPQPNR